MVDQQHRDEPAIAVRLPTGSELGRAEQYLQHCPNADLTPFRQQSVEPRAAVSRDLGHGIPDQVQDQGVARSEIIVYQPDVALSGGFDDRARRYPVQPAPREEALRDRLDLQPLLLAPVAAAVTLFGDR